MNIDAKALQRRVGVKDDGDLGPDSWRAIFSRFGANVGNSVSLGIAMAAHAENYDMLRPLRLAHFFAQVGHESGSFQYMEEIASGAAYEGRKDLGNVIAGDGKLFKGRGPIQITGRSNYRKYGRAIGINLEDTPTLAANPCIGLHLALEYWRSTGLNAPADRDDITTITKRINGGLNGFDDRKARLVKAKGLFL